MGSTKRYTVYATHRRPKVITIAKMMNQDRVRNQNAYAGATSMLHMYPYYDLKYVHVTR